MTRRADRADDGFTVIEVLVAIAVISTMMLSLGPLFVISMRVNHQQSNRQSAIQAADDAMERVRALQVSALLTGRDFQSTTAQAVAAPLAVRELLAGNAARAGQLAIADVATKVLAYDLSAVDGSGASAVLPTTPNPITLSGLGYRQSWYVGNCGRPLPAEDGRGEGDRRDCVAGESGAGYTPMYRVIVAVSWTDRFCSPDCTYISSTLISSKTEEPVFSARDSVGYVRINSPNPGARTGTLTAPVAPVTITADGSQVTWQITGQPAGITIGATTGIVSGTPTASGTFNNVQVIATGPNGQEDYIKFTWVIRPAPTLPAQGTITTPGSVAYTKTFTVSNGTAPFTWTFTGTPTAAWPDGTPPGLSIDAATGTVATISGTPTVAGANSVTVTVRDALGVTFPRSFTWTVPALSVNSFTVPNTKIGTPITPVTVTAAGGIPPLSWSATNLPAGLSIDPATGMISGTPTGVPRNYPNVVITVTDSSANAAARTASRTITTWQARL